MRFGFGFEFRVGLRLGVRVSGQLDSVQGDKGQGTRGRGTG
jgi:hypothetical protein